MTLNRNPDNFFAETEQVAFHTGHVVPGIDFTNDPLLQGRLFSYIDTQLRRVGPNFAELPINRPLKPVHNNQRDGFAPHDHQQGPGVLLPQPPRRRLPDALAGGGGGLPSATPRRSTAPKIRERSQSFSDHFSQATQFWNSMTDWEKDHIAAAFAFELNQVVDEEVRHRIMNEILVNIHRDLGRGGLRRDRHRRVARRHAGGPDAVGADAVGPVAQGRRQAASPALSMDKAPPPPSLIGRKVAVLVGDGVDAKEVQAALAAFAEAGLVAETIGPHGGTVATSGKPMKVNRAAPNAPSVVYDAVFVPAGVGRGPGRAAAGAAFRP